MYDVDSSDDLKTFSFLHYEKLKHQQGETISSIKAYKRIGGTSVVQQKQMMALK